MQFLLNLHHLVYIPIIVFTAVTAMTWSVAFIVGVMDAAPRPATARPDAAIPAPLSAPVMPVPVKTFRPVIINGGGIPAYLRAAQMPLRSGARAAQPYRASFGG